MSIPNKIKEKINFLYKNDNEMIEKLYNLDEDAIRKVASLAQGGINPDDVIVAFESKDQSALNNLYQKAKKLVGLQELYKELCIEYYNKDTTEYTEQSNNPKKRF